MTGGGHTYQLIEMGFSVFIIPAVNRGNNGTSNHLRCGHLNGKISTQAFHHNRQNVQVGVGGQIGAIGSWLN